MIALAEDWEDEREKEKVSPSPPYGNGANGWVNGTVGSFLERASGWGEDTATGTRFYSPPENPWKRALTFFSRGNFMSSFRSHTRFRQRYWRALTWPQIKVLNAILRCRTVLARFDQTSLPK